MLIIWWCKDFVGLIMESNISVDVSLMMYKKEFVENKIGSQRDVSTF